MADKTISTLDTELTTVGANDLIGVWDVAAAQYKKAKRSNVVGATITGGGTIALGGYTLTVPATGTLALAASGAWTPELQFGGAATGITYSARTAYYVKVGNLLFFTADIRLSSKGSATGNATIIGLPVTANGSQGNAVIPIRWTQMTTALVAAYGVIAASTTTIALSGLAAAGVTVSLLADAAFANNSILQLSGCYVVG